MKKVWLIWVYDCLYEPQNLLCICSSRELAVKRAEKYASEELYHPKYHPNWNGNVLLPHGATLQDHVKRIDLEEREIDE